MEDTRGKAVVRQASEAELVTFTLVVSEMSSMTGVTGSGNEEDDM